MKTQLPSERTLSYYGLTARDYRRILKAQGGVCAICKRPKEKLDIDHEHVARWKKMDGKDRKKHVRGLLCRYCNQRILHKGVNISKLKNAVSYLVSYKRRKT